jgi:hypothetical protein
MAAKSKNLHDLKPGSSTADAAKVGGSGDFGVSPDNRADRDYTSQNTKRADPGNAPPMASESADGTRVAGAGGNDAGVGSSSAGDLDADIIGVGGIGNIAQDVHKDHRAGADDAAQFGTIDRDIRAKQPGPKQPDKPVMMPAGDQQSTTDGEGADSAGRESIDGDNSFVGEVSSAEADGRDEAGE